MSKTRTQTQDISRGLLWIASKVKANTHAALCRGLLRGKALKGLAGHGSMQPILILARTTVSVGLRAYLSTRLRSNSSAFPKSFLSGKTECAVLETCNCR